MNLPLHSSDQHRFWEDDPWRVLRIMSEFVDSFEEMSQVPPGISVFGSARIPPEDRFYQAAIEMGRKLAKHGFPVITGGGPGIMEAANRGAAEVDRSLSVGLNIQLPREQAPNPYAGIQVDFRYFFARKVCLAKYSMGFVFFPGGYGTLDEFAEIITLVQTERIPRFPMVLFGSQHWEHFVRWINGTLVSTGMISPGDEALFRVTENVDEAVDMFLDFRREAGTRVAPRAPSADPFRRTAHRSIARVVHQITRLEHGLTLATAAMPHMASVSVGLWVAVGGRHEPAPLSGSAHFIEHMLFKGTRRRTARQISADVEGIGGYLNAFTSEDHTCFYSKALKDRYEDLVDVVFDMLLHSRFAPGDIRREREVIREEVAMYLDQPQQRVQELFNHTMWPGHPLGRPLTGTFATLRNIGRPELLGFLDTNYTAPAIVVAAAGALDHDAIVDAIRRRTRRLRRGEAPRAQPVTRLPVGPVVRLVRKPTEQSQLALGFRAYSRRDPRRFAVRLLNIVLGENMSSRLFQIVREDRGLAYSIYSTPSFWEDVGDLVVAVGLDAAKTEPVLRLVRRELRRLATDLVGPAELRRARDYALGQIDLGLENTEHHMMWLGEQIVTTGKPFPVENLKRRLAAVTAAEIREVARDLFRPDRCVLAAVSPLRSDGPLRRGLAA